MAYIKNTSSWTTSTVITTTIMDNFETIYTECSTYLTTHSHSTLYYTKTYMDSTYWGKSNDGPGSGADADLIYKSDGNLHASAFAGLGVPIGLVCLWYGAVGDIPSGWHICDGNSGTVNLTDRFVVGAGAGSDYTPGNTGGSTTFTVTGVVTVNAHVLTIDEMGSHRHPFLDKYYTSWSGMTIAGMGNRLTNTPGTTSGNTSATGSGSGHSHSAGEGTAMTGDAVNCMPFYYGLCYIQKIS